ncbi:hypothetical protein BCR42DRAFT_427314 [Absidia repens]|uniref:Uncharacterized protein n=1 Tax=Absidia repens TaxID=90262 RepID=A0A1X2HZT7_9FUNG|nr:hypothetical protein BCR42DRAFT_427314 [Absidia repens]
MKLTPFLLALTVMGVTTSAQPLSGRTENPPSGSSSDPLSGLLPSLLGGGGQRNRGKPPSGVNQAGVGPQTSHGQDQLRCIVQGGVSTLVPSSAGQGQQANDPLSLGSLGSAQGSGIPGSPQSDILIYYNDNPAPDMVQFHQCIPFRKQAKRVNFAKFSKTSVCKIYSDEACQQLQHEVPIPLAPCINVQNVLGVGSELVGSYSCDEVKLDTLPQNLNPSQDDPVLPPVP